MSDCRSKWLLIYALLLIAEQVFGLTIQHRIISGKTAADGQFPWQVILKKTEIDDLLCGGSIIHNYWILTAAHCTYGLNSIFMIFGSVLLNNPMALTMTSKEIIIHSNFNARTLNNDVSLIKLPTPLEFTRTLQPILLVSKTEMKNSFLGSMAIVTGFGLTDDEYLDFSYILLYAQVSIIDNSVCAGVFGSEVVTSSTLCAKGANNGKQSICSGDSGGPLIVSDSSGSFIQIGINSFVAQDACSEGYPSGYVRLTGYLNFIAQATGLILS